jgi:hypothetical protein
MAETKQEEQARLQNRTEELRREHEGLRRGVRPFDRVEHQKHIAELQEHKANLAHLRARLATDD